MNSNSGKEINTSLAQKPECFQKIAVKLMGIILASHPDMEAEIRWGKPTFGL
ncbi:hypothetical protein [Brassicibacter mesophilus]|uniref:hypothetical protein n=1 Tax=Brassicibacter mesophilus TaxID=745119 RepID=UPI003D1F4148